MRISDWSSDVCSSDLRQVGVAIERFQYPAFRPVDRKPLQLDDIPRLELRRIVDRQRAGELLARNAGREHGVADVLAGVVGAGTAALGRDAEHPARPAIFGVQLVVLMLVLDLTPLFSHPLFAHFLIIMYLVPQ